MNRQPTLISDNNYFFQEVVIKNPVLVGIIGLCPVVAICTSLKSALIMSLITILTLIVAQALSALIFKHLPQWLRLGLYALVGMVVVVPFILLIEKISPSSMLAFGIYLPLLAINPIITRQCEREGVTLSFGKTILNAVCAGTGYSIVLIITGFLRELAGSGAIFGKRIIPVSPASVFLMPAGGFIILAYLAAVLRLYFKKIDPEYAEELAKKFGIPFQETVRRGGSTNAGKISLTAKAVPVLVLGVPSRYVHTHYNFCAKSDLEAAADLAVEVIRGLDAEKIRHICRQDILK